MQVKIKFQNTSTAIVKYNDQIHEVNVEHTGNIYWVDLKSICKYRKSFAVNVNKLDFDAEYVKEDIGKGMKIETIVEVKEVHEAKEEKVCNEPMKYCIHKNFCNDIQNLYVCCKYCNKKCKIKCTDDYDICIYKTNVNRLPMEYREE